MTGIKPMAIQILTVKWKKNIEATQYPKTREKTECCFSASAIIRKKKVR